MSEFDGVQTVLESPDPDDAIYGLRSWAVDDEGRMLAPISSDKWKPGVNLAICNRYCDPASDGAAPIYGCQCGFYSYHRHKYARKYADRGGARSLVGAIKCVGRIDIGSQGMRSSQATVAAIVKPKWAKTSHDWSEITFTSLGPLAFAVIGSVLRLFSNEMCQIISVVALTFAILGSLSVVLLVMIDSDSRGHRLGSLLHIYIGRYDDYNQGNANDIRNHLIYDRWRELYPDVKVYRSLRSLRRAHRLYSAADINKLRNPPSIAFTPVNADNFWE